MSSRERVSPPSTRSSVSGRPRSTAAARANRVTCAARPSTVARTTCAGSVPGPIPSMLASASGRHHGAPRPLRAGHHRHAAAVAHRAGHGVEILGTAQEPPPAQPGDGRTGGVDLPVDAVGRVLAELPGHGHGQAGRRRDRLRAGVGQQERAGAVRALRLPGFEAMLPDERRLLVDAQAAHGERHTERVRPADLLRAADDGREVPGAQPEGGAGLLRPGAAPEVEEQRPRGGGGVGHEGAREAVQEPGVRGRHDPFRRDVAAQPAPSSAPRSRDRAGDRSSASAVRRPPPCRRRRSPPGGPARRWRRSAAGRCRDPTPARSHPGWRRRRP